MRRKSEAETARGACYEVGCHSWWMDVVLLINLELRQKHNLLI